MRRAASAVVLLFSGVLLLMQFAHRTFAQSELPRQTLWGVYWTVERGFTSTLEMKNNHRTRALTVQTSLYFASGVRNNALLFRQTTVTIVNNGPLN